MCAIWLSIGISVLPRSLDLVAHRGPDGVGWHEFKSPVGPVVMGHRRLSIVDPSPRANQPLCTNDRKWWITFNGEILNYRELGEELVRAGIEFHTQSDAEVLLRAVRTLGAAVIERFRGFFAFAVLDVDAGRVVVARDRYGIKPLYWWQGNGVIAFASEIKQFLAIPEFRARLNDDALVEYLAVGVFDHVGDTFFQDVRQLRPGEIRQIDLHAAARLQIRAVQRLAPPRLDAAMRDATALPAQRRRQVPAVELNLRAHAPLGVALSGGIDSAAIAVLAAELLGARAERLNALSVTFTDPDVTEERFAQAVVNGTEASWATTTVDPDELVELFESVIWHLYEPVARPSMLAQHKLFRAFRAARLKVALTGQGGDELLCGYPFTFGPCLLEILRARGVGTCCTELNSLHHAGYRRSDMIRGIITAILPPKVLNLGWDGGHGGGPLERLMRPAIEQALARCRAQRPLRETKQLEWGGLSAKISHALVSAANLPMLLHYEDRNSMAAGVEARPVLLDPEVVNACLSLPPELKLKHGLSKYALRRSIGAGLPREVAFRRDKLGFPTPESAWMRGPFGQWLRARALEGLEGASSTLSRVLDIDRTAHHLAQGCDTGQPVWALASLGVWMKRFSA